MSRETERIEAMSHEELVRHHRFAPVGDELLSGVNYDHFMHRLNSYGGITPEISKKVGWNEVMMQQAKIVTPRESIDVFIMDESYATPSPYMALKTIFCIFSGKKEWDPKDYFAPSKESLGSWDSVISITKDAELILLSGRTNSFFETEKTFNLLDQSAEKYLLREFTRMIGLWWNEYGKKDASI